MFAPNLESASNSRELSQPSRCVVERHPEFECDGECSRSIERIVRAWQSNRDRTHAMTPPVDLEAGGIGRDQDVANTQVSISRASIRHDTRSIEQDMSIRVVHTHGGDTWDIIDERTKGCLQPFGRTVELKMIGIEGRHDGVSTWKCQESAVALVGLDNEVLRVHPPRPGPEVGYVGADDKRWSAPSMFEYHRQHG